MILDPRPEIETLLERYLSAFQRWSTTSQAHPSDRLKLFREAMSKKAEILAAFAALSSRCSQPAPEIDEDWLSQARRLAGKLEGFAMDFGGASESKGTLYESVRLARRELMAFLATREGQWQAKWAAAVDQSGRNALEVGKLEAEKAQLEGGCSQLEAPQTVYAIMIGYGTCPSDSMDMLGDIFSTEEAAREWIAQQPPLEQHSSGPTFDIEAKVVDAARLSGTSET